MNKSNQINCEITKDENGKITYKFVKVHNQWHYLFPLNIQQKRELNIDQFAIPTYIYIPFFANMKPTNKSICAIYNSYSDL